MYYKIFRSYNFLGGIMVRIGYGWRALPLHAWPCMSDQKPRVAPQKAPVANQVRVVLDSTMGPIKGRYSYIRRIYHLICEFINNYLMYFYLLIKYLFFNYPIFLLIYQIIIDQVHVLFTDSIYPRVCRDSSHQREFSCSLLLFIVWTYHATVLWITCTVSRVNCLFMIMHVAREFQLTHCTTLISIHVRSIIIIFNYFDVFHFYDYLLKIVKTSVILRNSIRIRGKCWRSFSTCRTFTCHFMFGKV